MLVADLCRTIGMAVAFLIPTSFAQAAANPTPKLLRQYNPIAWVENLAVRPNGDILPIITGGTSAILNEFNPVSDELSQIYDFSAAGNALQSITAIKPDLFAVNVFTCNISVPACTPGTASSWLIKFRRHSTQPTVTKVTSWPQAAFLNGMVALNSHILLISDSVLGVIWSLDINSGAQQLLINDTSMSGTAETPTGVNGIRIWNGTLYFTNSAKKTFNSISIDLNTGNTTGDAVVIASGFKNADDFEIDRKNGVAYVADGLAHQIVRINLKDGEVKAIASVPGPTSLRWGVGGEGSKLYVSTNGGMLQYSAHNITLGGALYEVDI